MRANAAEREPTSIQRLTDALYRRQLAERDGKRQFVLHDGPPYANGDVHMGHLLNKVLKDVFNRHALISGKRVVYVPGWDCHGLPIELKALEALKAAGAGDVASEHSQWLDRDMDPAQLIGEAGKTARRAVSRQAKDFRRWGVMADWGVDKPQPGQPADAAASSKKQKKRPWLADAELYRTLDPKYEEAQLRLFADMVRRGCIHRGLKPVHWSPSSGTALAEAELEYADNHESLAIHLGFPVESASLDDMVSAAANEGAPDTLPSHQRAQELRSILQGASFLVWTTTPWTIPANVALAVSEGLEYCVVQAPAGSAAASLGPLVVGRQLFEAGDIADALTPDGQDDEAAAAAAGGSGGGWTVRGSFRGSELAFGAVRCRHPLSEAAEKQEFDRVSPVITAAHVTADGGTGVVHTAPGHGQEDFAAVQAVRQAAKQGRAHAPLADLPTICPVDGEGKYVAGTSLGLAGLRVQTEGNAAVVGLLEASGLLAAAKPHLHRYPYDWRTKQPILIRATEQWFASVEGVKDEALAALEAVRFTPAAGRNRLRATVQGRSEWCISRQRTWGVPIPALYDDEAGVAVMPAAWVEHVASLVGQHGSRVWFDWPVEQLLPPRETHPELWTRPDGSARQWRKSTDTLDVWFDSGASWVAAWAGREHLRHGPGAADLDGDDQDAATADVVAAAGGGDGLAGVPVADMVLEGSDQHRGWFQSSLLTRVASQHAVDRAEGDAKAPTAPYAEVLTHGFALDGSGTKMSKSLGNVVVPGDIIDGQAKGGNKKQKQQKKGGPAPAVAGDAVWSTPYGADVARYWAAASDWRKDVLLSQTIVQKAAENLRKLRNVMRFALGATEGCLSSLPAPERPTSVAEAWSMPAEALVDKRCASPLDELLLARLANLRAQVMTAYEQRDTARVLALLAHFAAVDLSGLYVDSCKDALYAEEPLSPRRQAVQAVLFEALRTLTICAAPICPFTAEDIFQHSAEPLGFSVAAAGSQRAGDLLAAPACGGGDAALTVFDVEWDAMHVAAQQAEVAVAGRGSEEAEERLAAAEAAMEAPLRMREAVSACVEALRREGAGDDDEAAQIGGTLDCQAVVHVHDIEMDSKPASGALALLTYHRQLADLLRVSSVAVSLVCGNRGPTPLLVDGDGGVASGRKAQGDANWWASDLLAAAAETQGAAVAASEQIGLASAAVSGGTATVTLQLRVPRGSAPQLVTVAVSRAQGAKCARCWKILPTASLDDSVLAMEAGTGGERLGFCIRCAGVLARGGFLRAER